MVPLGVVGQPRLALAAYAPHGVLIGAVDHQGWRVKAVPDLMPRMTQLLQALIGLGPQLGSG